jgi:uncharacterized protein
MDNIEILRQGYDAFGRGDIPAVMSLFDEAIEWTVPEGAPQEYRGVHRGHEGVAQGVFARLGEVWGGFAVRPETFVGDGDHVVVLGHYGVVPMGGGAETQVPFAHAWDMSGGKALRFRDYSDTALTRAVREGVALS